MKKVFALSFLVLFFTLSCTDRDDEVGQANIRIKNTSNVTYNSVQVGSSENVHSNVSAGDYSDYIAYETAYRYAYIKIDIATESYVLQPIDFVGETLLGPGFYTYELNYLEGTGQASLNFVVD